MIDDIIQFIINQDEETSSIAIYENLLKNNLLSRDELDFLGEERNLSEPIIYRRQKAFVYACVEIAEKRNIIKKGIKIGIEDVKIADIYRKINEE